MSKYQPSREIVTTTKLYPDGKTQVPREVRDILNLHRGKDNIVWIREGSRIYIENSASL